MILSSTLMVVAAIQFAALTEVRGHQECAGATTVLTEPCRVRREWTAEELKARVALGQPVVRDGDALTFFFESDADEVELAGGVQYPLSRLEGTSLWTLTVRVPRLDEAMLSYGFLETRAGKRASGIKWTKWRGPNAPAAAERATELSGRLLTHAIDSKHLGETRGLTIYEPPAHGEEPLAAVVYAGDGEAVESFAKVIDPAIRAGRLPRVLVVGIHSSKTSETRGAEYLTGFSEGDEVFLKHEQFFLEEVVPWVEGRFRLPDDAARRAVFGFSNSGAWALQMALRHPERFARSLAFSPSGSPPTANAVRDVAPQVFLLGGTLETPFLNIAEGWAGVFATRGVTHTLRRFVAGHDFDMWMTVFPEAVEWAFRRGTKSEG